MLLRAWSRPPTVDLLLRGRAPSGGWRGRESARRQALHVFLFRRESQHKWLFHVGIDYALEFDCGPGIDCTLQRIFQISASHRQRHYPRSTSSSFGRGCEITFARNIAKPASGGGGAEPLIMASARVAVGGRQRRVRMLHKRAMSGFAAAKAAASPSCFFAISVTLSILKSAGIIVAVVASFFKSSRPASSP